MFNDSFLFILLYGILKVIMMVIEIGVVSIHFYKILTLYNMLY